MKKDNHMGQPSRKIYRESDEKRSKIVDSLYSFDSLLFSSFGEWRMVGGT